MTGYYLEIGYNSGYSSNEEAWANLKSAAELLRTDPGRIFREVKRLEPEIDDTLLQECAEAYDGRDLSMTIVDEQAPERLQDAPNYIRQFASGGGAYRSVKEACRRAVCRILIEEMHRKKMEVNMRVS